MDLSEDDAPRPIPPFAVADVTHDDRFSGGELATADPRAVVRAAGELIADTSIPIDVSSGQGEERAPSTGTGRDPSVGVPGVGLEPTRPLGQRILSPPRLPFRHPGEERDSSGVGTVARWPSVTDMSNPTDIDGGDETGGGSHWLRWLSLIAIAIGAIAAGRKLALNSADKDFEQRLRALDAERN